MTEPNDVHCIRAAPRLLGISVISLTLIAFASLATLVYGHVFSNGLCCADDSTNAIVAKNFAFGIGYTNTIPIYGSSPNRLFDPQITTGPILNLPAAALILAFGNAPWVPGFVTATFSLLTLLGVAAILWKQVGPRRACAYLLALTFFLYNLTAGLHFEHWYSLLGEMPAALLSITGAAALTSNPDKRSVILAAGLLYGLAVATKVLALLSFFPVCGYFAWQILVNKACRPRRLVTYIAALAVFTLPSLCFEAWKLAVLGSQSYLQNLADFRSLLASAGKAHSSGISLTAEIFARSIAHSSAARDHFGFSVMTLVLGLVACGILIFSYVQQPRLRQFFVLLAAASIVHGFSWLFVSNGRLRYALIGLFIYFAAVSCVVFVRHSWRTVCAFTALLLATFSSTYPRLVEPVTFVATYRYEYTPRVENLLRTVALLKTLKESAPFVMGWWATAGDVEYAMPSLGNFVEYDHMSSEQRSKRLILVRNRVWVDWMKSAAFEELERRCGEILLNAPPYTVSRCPSDADGSQ